MAQDVSPNMGPTPDSKLTLPELQEKYFDGPGNRVDPWKDLGGMRSNEDVELQQAIARHPAGHLTDPEDNAAWQKEQAARVKPAGTIGRLTVAQQNANERRVIKQHRQVVPKQRQSR